MLRAQGTTQIVPHMPVSIAAVVTTIMLLLLLLLQFSTVAKGSFHAHVPCTSLSSTEISVYMNLEIVETEL